MGTIYGTDFDELTGTIDEFERLFYEQMLTVMTEVAQQLGVVRVAAGKPPPKRLPGQEVTVTSLPASRAKLPPLEPESTLPAGESSVSMDTLALIATLWAGAVSASLIYKIVSAYSGGARAIGKGLAGLLSLRREKEASRDVNRPGIDTRPPGRAQLPDDDEFLKLPSAEYFLSNAKNRMIRFSDEMWETARQQLLEGFLEGESIDKLRDRLVNVAQLSAARARTVARTEIISAENAGSIAMVETMGFTGTKIWEATEDPRTRPTHHAADKNEVDIKENFTVGGFPLYFPGDPKGPPQEIINCRCTLGFNLNDDNENLIATGVVMDPDAEWIGVLAVEGKPTGDMRMFANNSLSWADLPLPLLWQKETSDGHDGACVVGNITAMARKENMIVGRGTFDMEHEDGREAYRRVEAGYLAGVSIDADNLTPEDVEYVYSDAPAGDLMGPALKMTIFHAGRIRGATLVAIPAFVEASISVMKMTENNTDEMRNDDMRNAGVVRRGGIPDSDDFSLTAAAISPHSTATTDKPWDKGTQEKRLPSPMTLETAKREYAWFDSEKVKDGEIVKDGCKFPHHEVGENGKPGAANLEACSVGIGALHGARGGTSIPEADRKGVYEHLARHLRDGGREVPEFNSDTLTAASYVLTIPDVPPPWWFDKPIGADMFGALTVTDQGRVYGWLAPAGVSHRSFAERVTVPMGNVDYSLFLGRETITEGGGRVVTGALTMDCGHASTSFADPVAALDHYDNACSIVATINIGEDKNGVWVAGAIVPGVSANQITRMMACQLSGDWRPHRDKRGWREFAGALLVPVPGFAMSRTQASVRMEEGQLVASAIPVTFKSTECGCDTREKVPPIPKPRPTYTRTAQALAASLGIDKVSRIRRMREGVNKVRS